MSRSIGGFVMKFIFARHGETYANVDKIIYGSTHSEFTQDGLKQVDYIINHIKSKQVDYIYSSPLERTKIIAHKIEKVLGKDINIIEEIKEMSYGIFEGLTPSQAMDKYPNEYNLYMNDYNTYIIPKGENAIDFDKRVICFLDNIKNVEGTSIIVTHGGVIRTAMMHLLGLKSEDRWHFKILPGMIVEIEYKNRYGMLLEMRNFVVDS